MTVLMSIQLNGQTTNSIPNPGFEDGTIAPFLEGANNNATLLAHANAGLGNVRSGNYSLSFETDVSGAFTVPWWGTRNGNIFADLDTANDYSAAFSGWVKGPPGTVVKIFTFYHTGTPSQNSNDFTQDTLTGDWQEFTLTHDTPKGQPFEWASGRLDVLTPGAKVYFDDLTFYVKENTISFPGFEDGTTKPFVEGVNNNASLQIHANAGLGNVRTGNYSLLFETNTSAAYTIPWWGTRNEHVYADLEPAKDYTSTFSTWVKGPAGTPVRIFTFYHTGTVSENSNDFEEVTLNGAWQEITLTYSSPPGQPYTWVSGRLDVLTGNTKVYFDDLSFCVEEIVPTNLWSDPATWSPLPIPTDTTNVVIEEGQTVILDVDATVNTIHVKGTLIAQRHTDLELTTDYLLVDGMNALLDWGTATDPYLSKATITLTGPDASFGQMGTKFIGSHMGGTIQMHGTPAISWTQLQGNVSAGSTTITLKEPVNWQIDDEIVIVSSRRDHEEAEKRTIAGISLDRAELTLDQSLDFPHTGVIKTYTEGNRTWTADLRAQVGLLTHNITIQGDASTDTSRLGGHIMIHTNGYAYFDGVELYNMGQVAELGRYPFHWHMLGDLGQGQYFKNSSVHQSYNRALTIHGTWSTLVDNNFFYDHIGHGVFLEDGSEIDNVITNNVALLTQLPAPGEEVTPSDNQFIEEAQNSAPASYWITNPQNTFENNVAAGTIGTGFWFAFPESPMGLSADDPRFENMEPHTHTLGSFKGNMAHSTFNGFDIFDRLDEDHRILPNGGWDNADEHLIEDCLWYANQQGIYTGSGRQHGGGPVDNLIFHDNVFVENRFAVRLASYSKVRESVFVAHSGESLLSGKRHLYTIYDGAGELLDNYLVGWDQTNANFITPTGAAHKHPNHLLEGNITDHTGLLNIELPDFDLEPGNNDFMARLRPHYWTNIMKDVDGGISGKANTTIVSNHPFQLVGDEITQPNWINALRSDHHFAFTVFLNFVTSAADRPSFTATRKKNGSAPEESVYYIYGQKRARTQLPVIVNEGFEYAYEYESLPYTKQVYMEILDASVGDDFLSQYKRFGELGGLSVTSDQPLFTLYNTLTALRNATTSGYYIGDENGNVNGDSDLFIKVVATQRDQYVDITWTQDFQVGVLDTDGDQMADSTEIGIGRHPFTAEDLAAEFAVNGDFEGWTDFNNVTGTQVTNHTLAGTAQGAAQITNDTFDFAADEVSQFSIRLKAAYSSLSSGVSGQLAKLYFTTDDEPAFTETKVFSQVYTDDGSWQQVTLPTSFHPSWNGTITGLRLQVANASSLQFEIDYIKSSTGVSARPEEGSDSATPVVVNELETEDALVYPNPFTEEINLFLEQGKYQSVHLTDLNGKSIISGLIDKEANKLTWSLEDLSIPSGFYLIRLSGYQGSKQLQVIKR